MRDWETLRRESLIGYLRKHIAGEVRFDGTSRRLYSTDASIYQIEPLGVVLPRSLDDLVAVVQICSEMRVPLTARGGGTSLSGQSIGPGVIVDCSKYLNAIGPIDVTARTVRVQPGVVLDQLNRALASHGLLFGPDVATASRATLGGMIGNNSAGARSIVYGKTVDHVKMLRCVLSDGSLTTLESHSPEQWRRFAEQPTFEGSLYRTLQQLVRRHASEIAARFPHLIRRVSGYNLAAYLDAPASASNAPGNGTTAWQIYGARSLVPLLVGSEGTLAVVAEAELNLLPKPPHRGLLVPHFRSLRAALDALAVCLEFQPSAVELMDTMLIDLARGQRALAEAMAAIVGRPAALLMVEFSGEDRLEIADRIERLTRRLAGVEGVLATVPALEPALREPLWNLRSGAMPLLYGMPGDRKPVTFCEDAAVRPDRLPEFALRFRETLQRHGTDGAFYGHASVGCLHIRPLLNLKDPADVARMRRIMEDVTDLVLEFGGSLSGEHGDGLLRSEWNRKMYGDTIYQAFREIKRAFDPENLFNPGRIVDAPAMTENLRYPPGYAPLDPPTVFDYSKQQGFFRSIELCNGAGVCRKTQGGTMCPSYRATFDEKDSTRGRANALRLALSGQAIGPNNRLQLPRCADREQPLRAMGERWLADVMDLCLACKACKTECPSNVDLAKLKAEFLHARYLRRLRPLGHYLVAYVHRWNRWAAPLAPLLNWSARQPWVRWLLEAVGGIDRRRSLPRWHRQHFRRWFDRRRPRPIAGERGRVILLEDCFTTYHEPHIGVAAVQVLEAAGYRVERADLLCCGRALISKGFLREARALVQSQLSRLLPRLADATPILGLEPSCLLTLVDEWPELVPGASAQRVAAAAELLEAWLARQSAEQGLTLPLRPWPQRVLFHGHCHQRALVGVRGSVAALRLIPNLEVIPLDAGCCGMAGSFGFEREHFDLSERIANLQLLPALRAEPNALVAATGTSCRHQIHDFAQRRAQHPVELLAEAMEREMPDRSDGSTNSVIDRG